MPVARLLSERHAVRVAAVGKAVLVLQSAAPTACVSQDDARRLYGEVKPELVVAAISSLVEGPFVNNAFIELAHRDGIPIVCLQDYWANHRHPANRKVLPYYAAVCVLDDFAARLWREDGFTGEIHVTGNPAFDRFSEIDVSAERKRLREKFGVGKDTRVLIYLGEGTRPATEAADRKTFALVTAALREPACRDITLIVRPHPRATNTAYYSELFAGMDVLDTSAIPFSEHLLPMADIVVSGYSTGLIHACLLRIPAVSVLLPDAGRALLKAIGLDDFPPNTTGATIGVYEEDVKKLGDVLRRIFDDEKYRETTRLAQVKHFPLPTSSAKRVAKVVDDFLAR